MKTKILATTFSAMLLLSGCSDATTSDNVTAQSEEIVTVTNPFEGNSELIGSNETVVVSFNVNVNKSDFEYLNYEDNRLTIPLTMQNAGMPIDLGMFVFVDGILQTYSSDRSGEVSQMQIFSLDEKELSTVELYVDNIISLENLESTYAQVICIVNPKFTPTADKLREIASHAGDMSVVIPIKFDSAPEVLPITVSNEYESHPITDDEAKRFGFSLESDGGMVDFILAPAGESSRPLGVIEESPNGTQKLELYEFSRNYSQNTYRVSIYKNHKKINFNNGCEYIDIYVKDGFTSIAEIEIEDIHAGDFVYCTAVPVNISSVSDHGKKYETIPILTAEDMPEPVAEEDLYYQITPEQAGMTEPESGEMTTLPDIDDVDFSSLGSDWIQVRP